jgi:hypothetical protein
VQKCLQLLNQSQEDLNKSEIFKKENEGLHLDIANLQKETVELGSVSNGIY